MAWGLRGDRLEPTSIALLIFLSRDRVDRAEYCKNKIQTVLHFSNSPTMKTQLA